MVDSGSLTPAERHAFDLNRDGFVGFADALIAAKLAMGVPMC